MNRPTKYSPTIHVYILLNVYKQIIDIKLILLHSNT